MIRSVTALRSGFPGAATGVDMNYFLVNFGQVKAMHISPKLWNVHLRLSVYENMILGHAQLISWMAERPMC